MQATVELPKAFSVRDEHEFFPIQHLMARLNPRLMVTQVATGVHVNGGSTVYWGLVYQEGQPVDWKQIETASRKPGSTLPRTARFRLSICRPFDPPRRRVTNGR